METYGKKLDFGLRPPPFDGEVCQGRHADQAVIRGVTTGDAVSIILDSGADISVLPLSYKNYGNPFQGQASFEMLKATACQVEPCGKLW